MNEGIDKQREAELFHQLERCEQQLENEMTIEYNHTTKAGNAGDVWKHFILLTVADSLADTGQFTYVETHSGIGKHYLW